MEKKKRLWWKKQRLWIGCILLVLILCSAGFIYETEMVYAGTYDDAYTYYQTYGNEMRFLPGEKNEGEIYYATKGKKDLSAGTRYTTLGWKVRIFSPTGALADTVYYQLGGKHMTEVSARTVDGYEYCLYRVTLQNLKSRLSAAGLDALKHSGCNIVFDACITVRQNGNLLGGMTDAGPSWGDVYTTYNGIVNAAPWSSATKESLHSYYDKTVDGLFYEVKLTKGTGIQAVSGAGRYCFGTTVTIGAECEAGYYFSGWSGSASSTNENYSFVLYEKDVSFTATAKENQYKITYDAAGGKGSIPERWVYYHELLELPKSGFVMEGASLSAWKILTDKKQQVFTVGEKLQIRELVKQLGLQNSNGAEIRFFASWDEGPIIQTKEIFVSLSDAIGGRITEAWLAEKANAYDLEDGEIPYGKNENTSFFMENYQASDFTKLQKEASITKTFYAVDSIGNGTRKDVVIHIADTKTYPKEKVLGRVRFISGKYFWDEKKELISEEEGGLSEDSIWRWDEAYRSLLEKLF